MLKRPRESGYYQTRDYVNESTPLLNSALTIIIGRFRLSGVEARHMKIKEYRVWWTSEDRQGQLPGGEYRTREEAEAAIKAWRVELLRESNDEGREEIEAGTFSIDEEDARTTEYHVTKIQDGGVYGHRAIHCDFTGCAAAGSYLINVKAPVKVGHVYEVYDATGAVVDEIE
jgi:hypothetical protein